MSGDFESAAWDMSWCRVLLISVWGLRIHGVGRVLALSFARKRPWTPLYRGNKRKERSEKRKMFSKAYYSEIKQYFDRRMELLNYRTEELKRKEAQEKQAVRKLCGVSRMLLERKIAEISSVQAQCTQDEAEALEFLYSAMPMSDLLNYPAAVYLAYAKHAVFLWKEGDFAGKVPEKIFANYVLHHRLDQDT